ncbi:MAG: hypothetical protein ACI4RN_00020 [Oscillospiraceae bacterium]
MNITITSDYKAYADGDLLGYLGETNSRFIDVEQPTVDGADTYRLRFSYNDDVIYDLPIIDGKVTVTASMLRYTGDVSVRWLATKVNADNSGYDIVAKSNAIMLSIRTAFINNPIPTPEQAVTVLDEILNLQDTIEGNAQIATEKAAEAKKSAESAKSSEDTALACVDDVHAVLDEVNELTDSAKTSEINAKSYSNSASNNAQQAQFAKLSAQQSEKNAQSYAETAQTAAETATAKADSANASAETASAQADIATQKADIATEQANTASAQAESAINSANTATTQAGIATSQASIATAKASNAETYANNAQTYAETASSLEESAQSYAESASQSATSASKSATLADISAQSANSAAEKANNASQYADEAKALAEQFSSEVEQIQTNATDISDLQAEFLKPKIYKTKGYFDKSPMIFNPLWYPITVENKPIRITGVEIKAKAESSDTIILKIYDCESGKTIAESTAQDITTDYTDIVFDFDNLYLHKGEYRLKFYCNSKISYSAVSTATDSYSDGYINNTGSNYLYSTGNNKLLGTIKYSILEPVRLDETLTSQGKAADAKIVGDKISELSNIENIKNAETVVDVIDKDNYKKWLTLASDSDLTVNPFHIVHGASSNAGFFGGKYLCVNNNHTTVTLSFTLSEIAKGGIYVYICGKSKTDGSFVFKPIKGFSTEGQHSLDVDLAYYDVYSNVDVTQYSFLFANIGDTDLKIGDIKISYLPSNQFDKDEPVLKILENINGKIDSIGTQTDTMLVSPSGGKYLVQITDSGEVVGTPIIPDKTLFIGNSLLLGNKTYGMCASDENHDYYHYVTETITAKNSGATYQKLMGADYEGKTSVDSAQTWLDNTLASNLSDDLDLVVVQLGDNVNTADKGNTFKSSCKMMLQYIRNKCPSARVCWVGEWYGSATKQQIIANACAETGCTFINIADLVKSENQSAIGNITHREALTTTKYTVDSYTDDTDNKQLTVVFTVSDTQYTSIVPYEEYTDNGDGTISVTGYYVIVNSGGVASHPGDKGMLAIANRICYTLGITNSEDEIVEEV